MELIKNPDWIKGLLTGSAIMLLITILIVIIPLNKFLNDYRKINEMHLKKKYGHVKADEIES